MAKVKKMKSVENKKPFFITPHGARIFVRYDKFHYTGKLIIPDSAQRLGQTGRIVAVGPDCDTKLFWVGRRVLWPTFSGVQIKFQEVEEPFVSLTVDEINGFIADDVGKLTIEGISAG